MRVIREHPWLSILGAAFLLQGSAWLVYGKDHLYRLNPSLAKAVIDKYVAEVRSFDHPFTLSMVLARELTSDHPEEVDRFSAALKSTSVQVYAEERTPPTMLQDKSVGGPCHGCLLFGVRPIFNSPVVAFVESSTWCGGLCGAEFMNVSVHVMGRWFRVATWKTGVA